MITRPDVPRRRRTVLEIAVALSIVVHLLFGGVFFPLAQLVKSGTPTPKQTEPPMVALSDVVTIEKRKIVPRPHPVSQTKPAVTQKPPVAVVQKSAELPKPPEPVERPKRSVEPAQRAERKELAAAAKPSALPVVANERPREGTTRGTTVPRTDVALAPVQPQTPSTRQGTYTDQQLAAMQRQWATTIAQAREHSNPLNVPTEPPAGRKRYKLEVRGIYSDLQNGEGYISPTREWSQSGYNYFYMSYETVYEDGTYEQGSIPWPSRWPENQIADIQRPGWHGPMPCPAPGYTLPSLDEAAQMKLAVRYALHVCFPDRYPVPNG